MDWIGGVAQAGASLYGSWKSAQNAKEANRIARDQLDEQKRMNQWEKDKYDTTLKNQGEAMNTLGNAFGKALDANTSALGSSPAPTANTAPSTPVQANPSEPNAQNTNPTQSEPPLPTERD